MPAKMPLSEYFCHVTRFGLLTIIEDAPYAINGKAMRRQVLCRCDCGTEREFDAANVKWGKAKSCGCEYVRDPSIPIPPVKRRERKALHDVCGGLFHDHLTVIGEFDKPRAKVKSKIRYALCKCICGKIVERDPQSLQKKTKIPKSCGCKTQEYIDIFRKNSIVNYPGYGNWKSMKARCKPNSQHAKDYYNRGITVCERWQNSFLDFYNDMPPKPSDNYTIDRINVNGNYEPGNCRWLTPKEQSRNKRTTVWVIYKNDEISVSELIEGTMIGHKDAARLARKGYTGEQIIAAAFEALERRLKT